MGELRQNYATKRWVIIATERAKRPHELVDPKPSTVTSLPAHDPHCPFCPGNEEMDLEVLRLPPGHDWQVRVVRNRYPALQQQGERRHLNDGTRCTIAAVGYHEVVVESRRHNTCHALDDPAAVAVLLHAFRARGLAMAADERIDHITYFKNHGVSAGTSLVHPHAQIMGLPIIPSDIQARAEQARLHHTQTGECAFCRMVNDERQDGHRVVLESDHFVAFIPYAAYSPFHTWVLPKHHQASFLHSPDAELADLAGVLHELLRRLYFGLGNPDFNYVIRSAPLHQQDAPHLHWYLTLVPRVTQAAGFELGTDMYINGTLPEESALFPRNVSPDPGHRNGRNGHSA